MWREIEFEKNIIWLSREWGKGGVTIMNETKQLQQQPSLPLAFKDVWGAQTA